MAILIEPGAALVAEPGAKMILFTATPAAIAKLSAGHRQEKPIIPFDQLHIANDERVIESQRAKRPQPPAPASLAPVGAPVGTPVGVPFGRCVGTIYQARRGMFGRFGLCDARVNL
jgi:hypothetical protein